MLIGNPFPNAFGIDINDLTIKLVQVAQSPYRRKKFLTSREMRSTALPPGLIIDGEIQQPEPVRQKLLCILGKDCGSFKKIRSSWVVASLPEPKTFLKLIDIEGNPGELTDIDIAYYAKKHLPFELEDTYLDWQIINSDGGAVQVLIGAVPKVIADSYTYLLESVGLNPIALELEAISIARSMITENKKYTGEARAILDLGATRSNLIVYDNQSIQFSTLLNFSGELVTSAIEQGLRIEHGQAEKIKIANGLAYDPAQPKYLPSISALAEKLIGEIKTAFDFYYEHFSNTNKINHITMCGGMCNWKNIDNFISRRLKIAAHPGHPWKNLFNPKIYEFEKQKSLSFASAIGLALRAAHNPFQNGIKKM